MNVDDLKNHYEAENDAELARLLKKTRGAISKWRTYGIPISTQAVIQVQTKGKLKADLRALTA
jgi:DNA-binding transcriptional regulator Cro